jgi:hypothetical protein
MDGDDKHPATPLAPNERQAVRGSLSERERRAWLRTQAKWWAAWMIGVPSTIVVALKAVIELTDYLSRLK